jgi:hydroxymethylglutaryl-CoA lyase
MHPPKTVTLVEVGPRDGFQLESRIVPTERKASVIEELAAAGLRHIQVASFVHPERVPQMADAEALVHRLEQPAGRTYSALALNRRGVERAGRCGLRHVEISLSASDAHGRNNAGMPMERAVKAAREMIREARRRAMTVCASIQCAFGCATEGEIPPERVRRIAAVLLSEGIDVLSLADTTGMAHPGSIRRMLAELAPLSHPVPLALHLHDTRGLGLVNLFAALELGVARFDTAFGGMGGCPFVAGAAGNIATEDTVHLLHGLGIDTGVDAAAVARCSGRMEAFFGKRFPGRMTRVLLSGDRGRDRAG